MIRDLESPQTAATVRADAVLDTVGLYCPVPIIKTAERIRKMPAGAVLEVLSDDRVILVDMPAWCRSTGHEYLGARQDGTEYRLLLRKAARTER
ncbi:MAG: sulfurtransferase TusA family protein [bacterium]